MRAPAVECPQPQDELPQLERLGEVVVGAELEPGSLVVDPVGGGEHQDRDAAAGGDDAPGDLVAGRAGDVAVEDGDVVGVDAEQLQSGVAVAGDVGGDRFQPQPVADGFGQVGLVLDDQHAHAREAREPGRIVRHIEKRIRPDNSRAALTRAMSYSEQSRAPALGPDRRSPPSWPWPSAAIIGAVLGYQAVAIPSSSARRRRTLEEPLRCNPGPVSPGVRRRTA